MRYLVPTFRQLLIAGLCAAMALAVGCARQPSETQAKPVKMLAGKNDSIGSGAKPLVDAKPKPPAPKLDIIQRGVTLSWNDKAGRSMIASAKSDSFNLRTQVGTLLDFSAKLYENGELLASMTAPHAYVDAERRVVVATGGVELKFANPRTHVRSEWIKWTPDKHKIVGNGGVAMTYPNGTATAAAFVGDTAKKTLELRDSGKGLE